MKGNSPIVADDVRYGLLGNSLLLFEPQLDENGEFTCVAFNQFSSDQRSTTVRVLGECEETEARFIRYILKGFYRYYLTSKEILSETWQFFAFVGQISNKGGVKKLYILMIAMVTRT